MFTFASSAKLAVDDHWRKLVPILLFVLLVDAVLIALFLRWAYVAHHDLRGSLFYRQSIFSLSEGGLTELWGHAKLGAAICLVWLASRFQSARYYRALAAVMLVMFLADSLQLHERLVSLVIAGGGLSGRAEAFIDPLIKLALIAPPAMAAVGAFRRLPKQERGLAALAAAPLALLGFFAGAVDFLHVMAKRYFEGGRTISWLVEEGGEGLVATIVLGTALFVHAQLRGRGQTGALSRSPIYSRVTGTARRPRESWT